MKIIGIKVFKGMGHAKSAPEVMTWFYLTEHLRDSGFESDRILCNKRNQNYDEIVMKGRGTC